MTPIAVVPYIHKLFINVIFVVDSFTLKLPASQRE